MPELPEVETVRRGLVPWISGQRIQKVELLLPRLLKYPSPAAFKPTLVNRTILDLSRKGKYLIFKLETQRELIIHLGMSGRLIPGERKESLPPHTHFILRLEGPQDLLFIDPRTFGRIALVDKDDYSPVPGLNQLGLDPTHPDEYQWPKVQKVLEGNRPVKSFLLDQSALAGIGNIYADESLFRAGIHPLRKVAELSLQEKKRLFKTIKEVLEEAIQSGGTTILTFMDSRNNYGHYQNLLQVYGRDLQPCYQCKTRIEKIKIGGRSSHFCPRCQKL